MNNITCNRSAQSIFFALLFKKLINSSTCEIVVKGEENATGSSLAIDTYNHEALLHEYERRYEKISIFHEDMSAWQDIETKINALLTEDIQGSTLERIQEILGHVLEYGLDAKTVKQIEKEIYKLSSKNSSYIFRDSQTVLTPLSKSQLSLASF